jgi:hypothetical protein
LTDAVQQLLKSFDALTEAEQREAAAELLRRVSQLEWPELPDGALVTAAEELFLDLDAREAAHGQP